MLDVSRSMGWNGRLDAAKKELKEVFSPSETRWRESVVSDGLGIVQTAIEAALAEG